MPPKRKSTKASDEAVSWLWANDDGDFTPFATFTAIEDAYKTAHGHGTSNVEMNGWKYAFDWDKMTQRNTETGKVRDLQRKGPALPAVPAAASPEVGTWSWVDDKGAAKAYDTALNDKLEEGYQAHLKNIAAGGSPATLKVTSGAWTYDIDFVRLQQINTNSGRARPIQRTTPSGAVAAAPAKSARDAVDTGVGAKKSAAEDASKSTGAKSAATKSGTKLIKKGRGVVDPHSGLAASAHIYEKGSVVYQCMLNQTNVDQNNNKFYVIQLLESDTGSKYHVFTRWGRVGAVGQQALDPCFNVDAAIAQFCKKFNDKTKNNWPTVCTDRDKFVKYSGKYQLMDIDMGDDKGDDGDDDAAVDAAAPASSLPSQLQRLMRMISNKQDMERAMKELEIDTRKMPLGRISKKQIKEAFQHLKVIEAELKKKKANRTALVDSSSMFYTLIPHDFGFSLPPTIDDEAMLKRKMEMLEMLADLEVASKLISESKKVGKNPLDTSYESMNCELIPLSHTSDEFQRIARYVANTHGKTHAMKITVEDVFTVNRAGEATRYKANYGSMGNKQLLWHGSRTTNFMGILSQGLRIAPPEAPCTGYMFGKGVYFADCVTKSGNYCHASNEGLMLLCETALGKTLDLTGAKYMDKPQSGTNSTYGIGKMVPDPAGAEVVDGVTYPMGKLVNGPQQATSLLYNEFIVYDVSQCKMSYLLRVKFTKK